MIDEALIDPTDFGTIQRYLRHPQSPIDHLLHVRSRDMLAPLAEELANTDPGSVAPWEFPDAVERRLREGSLLLSSRFPLGLSNPGQRVAAATIPPSAACEVIYLPPFCLVHTPRLFEGTLVRQGLGHGAAQAPEHAPKFRIKPQQAPSLVHPCQASIHPV
jgi:hypothetical protein